MKRFKNGAALMAVLSLGAAVAGCNAAAPKQAGEASQVAGQNAEAPDGAPNIVFILVDDMGYGQLGVTGHPIIKTPNIDALADAGILFTDAYAGSTVCSPSRISLMTGKDAAALHSNANTILLREQDRTLANMLSGAGYNTALFGKFGIGTTFGKTDPMVMGFQNWFGLLHNITAHRQFPTMAFEDNEMVFIPGNVAGAQGTYAQKLFTDKAVDYINTQDADNPFFMLLSYTSPHAQLAAPEKFVAPYNNSFDETKYIGLTDPDNKPKFADYYPLPVDKPAAVQAGMVSALDAYVGDVMAALEAKGIADNTLVFFSSDNGPHSEGGADPLVIRAADPHRGGKRDLYDGGIRVPMIVSWPDKIKPGQTDSTPWAFADVLPTIADILDINPADTPGLAPNGTSVLPVLLNPEAELPERVLYWEFAAQLGDPNSGVTGTITQAARRADWKAVRLGEDKTVELYDIVNDKAELNDIAGDNRDIANEFAALFDARLAD